MGVGGMEKSLLAKGFSFTLTQLERAETLMDAQCLQDGSHLVYKQGVFLAAAETHSKGSKLGKRDVCFQGGSARSEGRYRSVFMRLEVLFGGRTQTPMSLCPEWAALLLPSTTERRVLSKGFPSVLRILPLSTLGNLCLLLQVSHFSSAYS